MQKLKTLACSMHKPRAQMFCERGVRTETASCLYQLDFGVCACCCWR